MKAHKFVCNTCFLTSFLISTLFFFTWKLLDGFFSCSMCSFEELFIQGAKNSYYKKDINIRS